LTWRIKVALITEKADDGKQKGSTSRTAGGGSARWLCAVLDPFSGENIGLIALDESHEDFRRVGLVFLQKPDCYGRRSVSDDNAHWLSKDSRFVRTIRVI